MPKELFRQLRTALQRTAKPKNSRTAGKKAPPVARSTQKRKREGQQNHLERKPRFTASEPSLRKTPRATTVPIAFAFTKGEKGGGERGGKRGEGKREVVLLQLKWRPNCAVSFCKAQV
jgi:hypothetical protein